MNAEARVWARQDFEPLRQESFRVRALGQEEGGLDLTLMEVSGKSEGSFETFSLLFQGPLHGVFPHDTYALSHPSLGALELFMGPVQSAKTDGVYYQAVFTQIRP